MLLFESRTVAAVRDFSFFFLLHQKHRLRRPDRLFFTLDRVFLCLAPALDFPVFAFIGVNFGR
jgi:hypothetical protein